MGEDNSLVFDSFRPAHIKAGNQSIRYQSGCMSPTVEQVKSAIERAFVHEPIPEGDIYYASDVRPDDRDGIYLNRAFRGKHWREVPYRTLGMEAAIPFRTMTDEASRFYLPAYLLASLDPTQDDIQLRTILAINPTSDLQPYLDPKDSIFHLLTKEQTDAVGLFLKYFHRYPLEGLLRDVVDDALSRYPELHKFIG